ncbi:hypothetical protein J5J83_10075 [Azoarcus sp. L1K30]|uniref:hypothetical protein n=1 Tax=Azoarcus sp. L1K30 TaxID=2820277 RepID=UPI001B835CAD|nr:hypothetical protein [Azoarcus sp. L1K30]MBR0566462.1 hypothetical protein [Azoarcus sp. L1K30]
MVIYMDMQTGKAVREAGMPDEAVPATSGLQQPWAALQLQEIEFSRAQDRMPPPRDIEGFLRAMSRIDTGE